MTRSLARKLAHDSHYSGSNLTMQRLFREVSNGGGRRGDSHYSGSNLTMQKLFDEEPKSRGVGRSGNDREKKLQEDHYSGSNLTLRRMFEEDTPPSQSVTDGTGRSAGRFTNIRVVESVNKAGNVDENKLPTGVKRKGKVVETRTDLAANQKAVQGKIDEKAKTKTDVSTASNDNKQFFDRRLENTAQSTAKSPLISSKYPATETRTGPINRNTMTSGQLGGNLPKSMQITGTGSSASGNKDIAKAAIQITKTNDLKQSSNSSPAVPKSGGNKLTSPSAAQPAAASASEKKVKKASKTERRMEEKQTQTDPTKLATKWTMTTEKKTMSTFTQTDPVFNLAITMKEAEAKLAYGPDSVFIHER